MKLRISVTSEILEKSKMCGKGPRKTDRDKWIGYSCALSYAVLDIWPNAYVYPTHINVDGYSCTSKNTGPNKVYLPAEAIAFIKDFDHADPETRVNMQPISFEIDVPDEVINRINISEITELLKDHPTLQIV